MHVTTWKNPTDHVIKFRLYRGQGRKPFEPVEVKPGATIALDGIHDHAIQTTHHSVVTGGLAPQLVAEGREKLQVHTSILDAQEAGDLERSLAGRRAGAPVSLDAVAELRSRMERFEADGRAAIDKANREAGKAEDEAEEVRAQLAAARAHQVELEAELTKLRAINAALPVADAPAPPAADTKVTPATPKPKP